MMTMTNSNKQILDEIVSCHHKGKSNKHLEVELSILADKVEWVDEFVHQNHIPDVFRYGLEYEEYLDEKDVTNKDKRFSLFKKMITYCDPHDFICFIHHNECLITARFQGQEGLTDIEVFDNLEQFYFDYKKQNYALVVLDGGKEEQGKYPPLNFTNEELFDLWSKSEQ